MCLLFHRGVVKRMINYDFNKRIADKSLDIIKRRRNIFLSILMLFLLAILFLLLLTTDIFDIREITVSGNEKLSYNNIVDLSGVIIGQNIFEVDKRQVERSLEANPYIVVDSIKRRLPAELVINIIERQEALMIEVADGYALVDQEGIYLQHVERKGQWMLPIVIGMDDMVFDIGDNISNGSNKGKALVKLYAALKEWGMLSNITHIDIQSEYDIIVMTDWGMQIRMGDSQDLDTKMAWIQAALKDLADKGQTKPEGVLDVAYASQAIYTPYYK